MLTDQQRGHGVTRECLRFCEYHMVALSFDAMLPRGPQVSVVLKEEYLRQQYRRAWKDISCVIPIVLSLLYSATIPYYNSALLSAKHQAYDEAREESSER